MDIVIKAEAKVQNPDSLTDSIVNFIIMNLHDPKAVVTVVTYLRH